MRRRRFVQALAAVPAAPVLAAQTAAAPQNPAVPPAQGGRGGRGAGGGRGAQEVAPVELTTSDTVAAPVARFFTPPQFAALRRLSGLLTPPLKGNPGALECGAPEFLDFLLGVSPADRQLLYRNGLDALNALAKKQFGKPFAEVDDAQAHTILQPLLVAVPWTYDPPRDPLKHFLFAARQDVETATRNSPEWSAAAAGTGRRGGAALVWNAIDPVYRG